jgi:hypothetical protein
MNTRTVINDIITVFNSCFPSSFDMPGVVGSTICLLPNLPCPKNLFSKDYILPPKHYSLDCVIGFKGGTHR